MGMLYTDDGILVNSSRFADEEAWFELIGNVGRAFSFMHAADRFAGTEGELFNGKRLVNGADVEEVEEFELDCAATYPLTM